MHGNLRMVILQVDHQNFRKNPEAIKHVSTLLVIKHGNAKSPMYSIDIIYIYRYRWWLIYRYRWWWWSIMDGLFHLKMHIYRCFFPLKCPFYWGSSSQVQPAPRESQGTWWWPSRWTWSRQITWSMARPWHCFWRIWSRWGSWYISRSFWWKYTLW